MKAIEALEVEETTIHDVEGAGLGQELVEDVVFVCAKWITGFDVPSCSTIYLDKPMKNHTLMQTIARANRVWREKQNGFIVDYVGIFRNLQKALAIYEATQGGAKQGELPIKDKLELVRLLRQAIQETTVFCRERGVDLEAIRNASGFQREKLKEDALAPLSLMTRLDEGLWSRRATSTNSSSRCCLTLLLPLSLDRSGR